MILPINSKAYGINSMRLKTIIENEFYPTKSVSYADNSVDGVSIDVITIYDSEDQLTELIQGLIPFGSRKSRININQEFFDYTETDQIKMLTILMNEIPSGIIEFSERYEIKHLIDKLIDKKTLSIKHNTLIKRTDKRHTSDDLLKSIKYHASHMNGQRWPELEIELLHSNRSKSVINYVIMYLNNIKEPWPEGERIGELAINEYMLIKYISKLPSKETFEYLYKRPKLIVLIGLYRYAVWLKWLAQSTVEAQYWTANNLISDPTGQYDISIIGDPDYMAETSYNRKDLEYSSKQRLSIANMIGDFVNFTISKLNLTDPVEYAKHYTTHITHDDMLKFVLTAVRSMPNIQEPKINELSKEIYKILSDSRTL